MIKIAVDAMGGDFAPKEPVLGAMEAVKKYSDLEIVLYGDETKIREYLTDETNITIKHCDEFISMDEKDPAMSIRKKKGASLVVAMKDAREGVVEGVVTAGPTGAVISGGLLVVKRIKGFQRPALGPILPTVSGKNTILLDVGANADCKPEYLLQFAQIGSIYSESVNGVKNPKVALLNIGEEESKGTQLQLDTFKLLQDSNLNFVGNIEGKQILSGDVDVIVTDGYSGNIALKTMEGSLKAISGVLKQELKSSLGGILGAVLASKKLKNMKKRFDPSEVGGAVLFGLQAPVIKAHGSSDSVALLNAIKQARNTVEGNVVGKIKSIIENEGVE